MFLSGTGDARGFRQWKEVNRWVKKGARAIHILVPCFKKEMDEGTGEEKDVLRFFKSMPVFRFEDTEGEKLDYELLEVPELPLLERAGEWGISVKVIPGNYRYYGYYAPGRKEIVLASPEESVWDSGTIRPFARAPMQRWPISVCTEYAKSTGVAPRGSRFSSPLGVKTNISS